MPSFDGKVDVMSKTHSQSSSDTSDIIGFEQPITKKINDKNNLIIATPFLFLHPSFL